MTTPVRAGASAPAAGPRPGTWIEEALCAQTDPEAFHPRVGESSAAAKRVCAVCPVRAACLAYALGQPELAGVWGGLTPLERGQLRRWAR
ncbi:WhiB family transcriptional regulator [Streptomyces longispororuber]|uniref:WhiB family transcriptional regulator n=1 Tax=Streptomyces longispororuber TaxID=68230 RepID=UPI0036F95A8D